MRVKDYPSSPHTVTIGNSYHYAAFSHTRIIVNSKDTQYSLRFN